MNTEENGIPERLAALSLERCLTKLSKVSAGTWQLTGISGTRGTIDEAVGQYDFRGRTAAAVYVGMKDGAPLASLMLLEPKDMDCVSKCFLGYSFPKTGSVSQSDEIMLLELGNILLNALNNSVMNALRRSFMPSAPRYIAGDRRAIVEELGAAIDLKQDFRTITASLTMRSGNLASNCKIFALISEELALELEGMRS